MTNATPSLSPVLHEIHVLRIGPCPDPVALGAHALAEALTEANRLLAPDTQAKGTR